MDRLSKSFTKPTLQATPGDLSLVLPKRHLDNILEMIQALNNIAPGMTNDDTLLYGVEVKFYSSRITLTKELEMPLKNIFAAGDGAGVTRGLSQAGASGVYVARTILSRMEKKRKNRRNALVRMRLFLYTIRRGFSKDFSDTGEGILSFVSK